MYCSRLSGYTGSIGTYAPPFIIPKRPTIISDERVTQIPTNDSHVTPFFVNNVPTDSSVRPTLDMLVLHLRTLLQLLLVFFHLFFKHCMNRTFFHIYNRDLFHSSSSCLYSTFDNIFSSDNTPFG